MSEGKLTVARLPPLQGSRVQPLGGQSYRLNGKVHPLPPPKALRPYVDTKAGEVDTWPAHASGLALSSSAAMLSKNKSLVLVNEEEGKASIIPKPRFLEQLQTFLHKELHSLGVTDVSPGELRLQAHREVFEYLIEDFKTYKPLLAAIKNEYEMMLAFQRQQIRQLEPLKQMLVTVSEQCDQKIMSLQEEERQEVANMRVENRRLQMKISSMANEQKDLQEQVSKLQETLREEHQKYRDECDARKLLVADINDLRYQHEDYLASKQTTAQDQAEEDPVMLKIALKKARDDEKAASVRLAEMVANYGDVIPRRDFEALEKTFKELEEQSELTQADFRRLQAEHNALLDIQKEVTAQRDQFYLELENLKRSSTPRPDWERCGEVVSGGAERWKEVSAGKSSNELVDVLIQEVSSGGASDSMGAEFFDGQGTDDTVPVYLRYEGQVRNRRLGKRDTLLLIRDIWREKTASEGNEKLGDFLHSYLLQRFAIPSMVVEWAYNLDDALQRFASQDETIDLFWKVLIEEADENVYHSQLQNIHNLLQALTKVDVEGGNTGTLDKEQFQAGLKASLPSSMDEGQLAAMLQAADTDLGIKEGDPYDYKSLFTEDDEGKTGPFLNEVKKCYQQLKDQFIDKVKNQLTAGSEVTVDDLRQAVAQAAPSQDSDVIESYLMWTFGVQTAEALAEAAPLEISRVVERLQNMDISLGGNSGD